MLHSDFTLKKLLHKDELERIPIKSKFNIGQIPTVSCDESPRSVGSDNTLDTKRSIKDVAIEGANNLKSMIDLIANDVPDSKDLGQCFSRYIES